jgi:regulator of sigma E protease
MNIVIAILMFAVLVLVHEFGHFIVAKRAGVRVDEFAIGFPPRLIGIKRGETTYSLNLIPLGGYVRMPGENGETTDRQGNPDPRTFAAQTAGKRAAILVAGVTMNFIFAWFLYTGFYAVTQQAPQPNIPIISVIEKGSPAQAAGLKPNDRIIAINGQTVHGPEDVSLFIHNAVASDHSSSATVPLTLTISRDGQQRDVQVQARKHPPVGQGAVGIGIGVLFTHIAPWQAPAVGIWQIGYDFQLEGQGIHDILAGLIKPSDAVAGPVGIVSAAGDAANAGFGSLLFFTAFLSWNLAVVNLLPIPGLDGGRLLILGVEVLRRGKRLAPEREALINLAGMIFLLSLIAVITFNDISRIVSGH